jgi:hypothetical protein
MSSTTTSPTRTLVKALFVAPAMAVGALGFITVPTAEATPMVPAAPPPAECAHFGFPGDTVIFLGSGNRFDFVGSNPEKLDNKVLFVPNDGSAQRSGTITGNINGRAVHMQTIVGNDVANFDGTIGAGGGASGSVFNLPTPDKKVFWEIKNPFPCLDAPAQQQGPAGHDTDGDGLSDADELKFFTNIFVADTDFDGVSDGDEVKNHTNPLNAFSK